jgi:hypothetical protein
VLTEDLKDRLSALSSAEQRHVIAFLHFRLQPPEFWKEMEAILDDKDPTHWFTREEVRNALRDPP